jgi:hypothetical protein
MELAGRYILFPSTDSACSEARVPIRVPFCIIIYDIQPLILITSLPFIRVGIMAAIE